VRKLKEIDTLNPLTILGIFAGYFNYVMAAMVLFLATAKRSPDTFNFAWDKPLNFLQLQVYADPENVDGIASKVFNEGVKNGDYSRWTVDDCCTFFRAVGLTAHIHLLEDQHIDGSVLDKLKLKNVRRLDMSVGAKYLLWLELVQCRANRKIATRLDFQAAYGLSDPRSWKSRTLTLSPKP